MTLLLLLLLTFTPLHTEQPSEADREAIEAAIVQLFDAMRESNMEKAADVFHERLQLSTVVDRGAGSEVVESSAAGFLEAIGRPKEQPWDEHYSNLQVQIDGDLAIAWMDYRFYLGDEFSHCGVNAIKFIRTAAGWKMFSITDTRRETGC
jgi:hypothetical protein